MDFGSSLVEEENPFPKELTPPLSFHPKIPPLIVNTLVHSFGIGGCIVEEEIPPSWQEENQLKTMDEDSEEETPHLSPLRLLDEHL
jgi:hypothetical protein